MTVLIPLLILTGLSLVFCLPILLHPSYLGAGDWDYFFFFFAVPRETILRYGQFPLWNPYSLGGYPLWANPQAGFLSPTYLLHLLFGPVVGMKLDIVVHMAIGMIGMWLLARHLAMGRVSSFLPPVLYLMSGWYPLHLIAGHAWMLPATYIPFAVLFFLRCLERPREAVLVALTLTLIAFEAGTYPGPYTILLLGVLAFFLSLQERSGRPLKVLGGIVLLTLLLSAVKLLPLRELLQQFPRFTGPGEALSLSAVGHMLLDRNQDVMTGHAGQQGMYWHEYGAYVGPLALILAGGGALLLIRRWWPWTLTGLFFLLLARGNFDPCAPWNILHLFPVFDTLKDAPRFRIVLVFTMALLAGAALTRIEAMRPKWAERMPWPGPRSWAPARPAGGRLPWPRPEGGHLLALGLVALVTADLFFVNSRILKQAFLLPPMSPQRDGPFRQIAIPPFYGSASALFPAFLNNEGALQAIEPLNFPSRPVTGAGGPGYRGEVYLEGGQGTASYTDWSPNRLVVQVSLSPGSRDRLVINQRFMPGWRSGDVRPVEPWRDLISTQVTSADREVVLFYRPTSVLLGALLSCGGILLSVLLWRRGPRHFVFGRKVV